MDTEKKISIDDTIDIVLTHKELTFDYKIYSYDNSQGYDLCSHEISKDQAKELIKLLQEFVND